MEVLNLLNQTREKLGFKLCTAYLSVTYFDQFLLKQHIHIHVTMSLQLSDTYHIFSCFHFVSYDDFFFYFLE